MQQIQQQQQQDPQQQQPNQEQPKDPQQPPPANKPKEGRRASRWNREDEKTNELELQQQQQQLLQQQPPPQQPHIEGGLNLADRLRNLAGCGDNNEQQQPGPGFDGGPPMPGPWNNGKFFFFRL